jgi:endonuclease YncB( thermonuclease family)
MRAKLPAPIAVERGRAAVARVGGVHGAILKWPIERVLATVGAATLLAVVLTLIAGAVSIAPVGIALVPWRSAVGPAGSEVVEVVRVIDGDTLSVAGGRTVRILAMDAPETANPNMTGPQPFGPEAARRLESLVADRSVALERDVSDADHYGRLLRHVWIDGELVSEILLREGLACWGSTPPDTRYSDRLRRAEDEAKAGGLGLWGQERPTPLPIFGQRQ